MARRPVIGILGGMGPAATGQFLLELTRSTPAACDQDHYHTIIECDPAIPDRTTAILAGDNAPLQPIRAGLERLIDWGASLLAVPCNTAHYYINMFADTLPVPLVHIVDATLARARCLSPQGAWLTATTGTVRTGLYQQAAANLGYPLYLPDDAMQDRIMQIVGLVKAGEIATAGVAYRAVADQLYDQLPLPAVTACTELPLAFDASGLPAERAVSSLTALATATVAAAQRLTEDD